MEEIWVCKSLFFELFNIILKEKKVFHEITVINKYYFQALRVEFMKVMLEIAINFRAFSISFSFFSISHLFIICLSSWMIKSVKYLSGAGLQPPPHCYCNPVGLQVWDLIQEIKETLKVTLREMLSNGASNVMCECFNLQISYKQLYKTNSRKIITITIIIWWW